MQNVAQTVGDGALDVPPIEMRNEELGMRN